MRLIGRSRRARKRPHSLTSREIEVLEWVARGGSARKIGEILHITKRTVDAHVFSAVSKVDSVNRTHAVAIAVRHCITNVQRRASSLQGTIRPQQFHSIDNGKRLALNDAPEKNS